MAPHNFLTLAFIISSLVYIFNWGLTNPGQNSLSAGIHASSALIPEDGRLHILVTGGAGFIGSHSVLQLLEEGHAVTVFDNLSRGNSGAVLQLSLLAKQDRFRFVNMDLGDRAELFRAFKNTHPTPDLVMHFAAIAYVGESMAEPLRYYKNVTVATTYLLEAMQAFGVTKLVYSSTCAVYGNQEVLPITEDSPPNPNSNYGQSKLMAEKVIQAVAAVPGSGLKSVILRYFNVYGSDPLGRLGESPRPELRQHSRISGACLDAALGLIPHLTIKGTKHPTPDGTCIRDYIHVKDLVAAHVLAINHLDNPPALFNVGSGRPVSVHQFVSACRNVTGADIRVVEQEEARPGDYAEVYAKIDKIQSVMGWRPVYTDITDGLRHAWKWRQSHPNGYE